MVNSAGSPVLLTEARIEVLADFDVVDDGAVAAGAGYAPWGFGVGVGGGAPVGVVAMAVPCLVEHLGGGEESGSVGGAQRGSAIAEPAQSSYSRQRVGTTGPTAHASIDR